MKLRSLICVGDNNNNKNHLRSLNINGVFDTTLPKNIFLKMYSPSYCILASGFGFKPRKLGDKVNLLKHQAKYQHLRVLEIKFHMNNLVTVI